MQQVSMMGKPRESLVKRDPLLESELESVLSEQLELKRRKAFLERQLRRVGGARPLRSVRGRHGALITGRSTSMLDTRQVYGLHKTASREIRQIREELESIAAEADGLQADYSARTPTLRVSDSSLDFAGVPLSLMLREGDAVTILVIEDDPNSDDLVATANILLDQESLSAEHLELSGDGIELLEVQIRQEG